MELTEFLLERIAEDEAAAQAVTSGAQWTEGNYWITDYDPRDPSGQTAMQRLIGGMEAPDWQHYSRHDPARVLAQCAAYREIVADHPITTNVVPVMSGPTPGYACDRCARLDQIHEDSIVEDQGACTTLRALASIYAGAEGWREEWAL